MATTRNTLLDALARRAPAIVDESRAAANAATQRQLGQAVQQAAPTGNIEQQSQQLAEAAQVQQGQNELQSLQQGQQLAGQIGELQQQEIAQAGEASLGRLQRGQAESQQAADLAVRRDIQQAEAAQRKQFTRAELAQQQRLQTLGLDYDTKASFLNRQQRESLAKLGGDIKQQLFDSRLEFERGEAGRQFANERQLADWTAANAADSVAFAERMQTMQNEQKKMMILLESAHNRITQELQQASADKKQKYSLEVKGQLIAAKAALEKKMREKAAEAANKSLILGAIGAGVGAAYGGAPGAVAGASIGQAAGSAASQ